MDPGERTRKKILEARRIRDVPPEQSIRSAARMIEAARRIAEAADRARA
jgi:hypothetical protein